MSSRRGRGRVSNDRDRDHGRSSRERSRDRYRGRKRSASTSQSSPRSRSRSRSRDRGRANASSHKKHSSTNRRERVRRNGGGRSHSSSRSLSRSPSRSRSRSRSRSSSRSASASGDRSSPSASTSPSPSRSASDSRDRSASVSVAGTISQESEGSPRSGDEEEEEEDDEEGQVSIAVGTVLKERYEVLSVAGQGTFGTVLDVFDRVTETRMALKVVRSVPRYLEAAQVEIDILAAIRRADSDGRSLCVRFLKDFTLSWRGQEHACIGFEKLGRSLYEFIKKNEYRGFSLKNVARFGYQLLTAVAFCHKIKLIHTDLKPENVLLRSSHYRIVKEYGRYQSEEARRLRRLRQRSSSSSSSRLPPAPHPSAVFFINPDQDLSSSSSSAAASRTAHPHKSTKDYREPICTDIRLIDFGGATFEHDHHSRIINTRQYRAPEVVLGCGWSYPSDLWSVGAILPELFTGELLFATHEDLEHLALMERILEQRIPESLSRPAIEPFLDRYGQPIEGAGPPTPPRRQRSNGRDADSGDEDMSSQSRSPRERSGSNPRADLLLHLPSGRLRWPDQARSNNSIRTVEHTRTLRELIPDPDFVDLLQRLLTFDPAKRISARDALQHRFFDHVREEFEPTSSNHSAPTSRNHGESKRSAPQSRAASSSGRGRARHSSSEESVSPPRSSRTSSRNNTRNSRPDNERSDDADNRQNSDGRPRRRSRRRRSGARR